MARNQGGEWLVRLEDDTPQLVPGAADAILYTLERFGFYWDGAVICQSHRLPYYQEALQQLSSSGLAYPCTCSR